MNDRFVEDIKNRVDLVEVIRKYATIKKTGKNFACKSPFRNERTPSFSVSQEKQVWYDFGASEGGDVISFVEKIENCSFAEAVEILADTAGIEMPKDFGETKGIGQKEKKDIFALHAVAADFFASELKKDKATLKYCKDRHISMNMIEDWNLGYGGDVKNGLTQFLLKKGFSEALISQSGVAFVRDFGDKTMQDRFTSRLMIPIREARNGEIVAFSGRIVKEGAKKIAKYINSPENPVYHKSATLFGLDKARGPIRDKDAVVLVEGNFDVVFAHDRGFCNVVATCGTALTEEHLRALKRLTKNIYLAFDQDLAGKKATLKSAEMLLKMELNPYIVTVDGAKDFGEFLEDKANAKVLQKELESPVKAMDFFFEKFSTKNLNGTVDGEKKFLDSFFYFLGLVSRPIEVDDYLSKMAEKLIRSKSIIEAEFEKFKSQDNLYAKEKYVEDTTVSFSREAHFLGFLSANWDFFQTICTKQREKILELFGDEETRNFLAKKIDNTDFSPEERQKLLGWEMYGNNFYETSDNDFLKKEFQVFAKYLKLEKEKRDRVIVAKNIGKKR